MPFTSSAAPNDIDRICRSANFDIAAGLWPFDADADDEARSSLVLRRLRLSKML